MLKQFCNLNLTLTIDRTLHPTVRGLCPDDGQFASCRFVRRISLGKCPCSSFKVHDRRTDNFRVDDSGLVQRAHLRWSPTHPWQHHAVAPILSVCYRTRRLSSCGAQVDCQWSSYVTANRIVSSASAPRKASLEYLPNGAGRPPGIHRHNLGTDSG